MKQLIVVLCLVACCSCWSSKLKIETKTDSTTITNQLIDKTTHTNKSTVNTQLDSTKQKTATTIIVVDVDSSKAIPGGHTIIINGHSVTSNYRINKLTEYSNKTKTKAGTSNKTEQTNNSLIDSTAQNNNNTALSKQDKTTKTKTVDWKLYVTVGTLLLLIGYIAIKKIKKPL